MPDCERLTLSPSPTCSAIERLRCTMPMPPARARAIARRASVTVSMAAEINGIASWIERVRRVSVETSLGRMSESAGTSRTSSNVSPSGPNFSSRAPSGTWAAKGSSIRSLPFDRAWRLRCDVVDHAIDAVDLVDEPRGDLCEQLVRQARPVGRHRVLGGHGAHGDRVLVGAGIAHHADRADRRKHREDLPQLTFESGAPDLV